ncbi:hypothetical protein PFICI_05626 [Pestalotiopsis fici W106-1]|uniref:2EXR domain-containing protein n=1 Tax=Pestalotiopsis fici (strain W106-1 / CGMCC3.15140) TaxID=1229662 RepID=W3XCI0_PESFW|nr:uncharacterized protein PFICI_05626 [Pestalotiopsis fici W106-1]ETS83750.1 hypothetical protein PFICI_05626 [Pestalotiopsis fici W106-1]
MSHFSSFHLFSSLPTEIRLEIWQYSCSSPRVVEVYYDAKLDQCTTITPPPAILQACSEARREALRIYKPLFGTSTHRARIYFHPQLDTLYIPRPPSMGYDDNARDFAELCTGASEVVNLALDHVNPAIRKPWETYNKYALMSSFPKVMEVYLVLDSVVNCDRAVGNNGNSAKHGFIKLAEPLGDPTEICKLLQDVKMSFTYEVGADFGTDGGAEGVPEPPVLVLKAKVETDYLRLL